MLLPILPFACCCFSPSRTSLKLLENIQKRVLNWVCRDYHSTHKELLLKCNLLPVPMFFQLKHLLFLSKYFHEMRFTGVDLNITTTMSKNSRMMFDIKTARTEKARAEFCFRTCRLANKLPERVAFFEPLGLKNRILASCGNTFTSSILKINCAPTKYTVTAITAETQLGYSDNNCRGEVSSA